MTNEATEQDPLEYVRQRLQDMKPAQLARIAVDADLTERTLYNVMKGERDVKYGTVKKVHKALKDAEAVEAQAATNGHP
jgi:predicted transcriptional regulator